MELRFCEQQGHFTACRLHSAWGTEHSEAGSCPHPVLVPYHDCSSEEGVGRCPINLPYLGSSELAAHWRQTWPCVDGCGKRMHIVQLTATSMEHGMLAEAQDPEEDRRIPGLGETKLFHPLLRAGAHQDALDCEVRAGEQDCGGKCSQKRLSLSPLLICFIQAWIMPHLSSCSADNVGSTVCSFKSPQLYSFWSTHIFTIISYQPTGSLPD